MHPVGLRGQGCPRSDEGFKAGSNFPALPVGLVKKDRPRRADVK